MIGGPIQPTNHYPIITHKTLCMTISPILGQISCTDPESFLRGGPSLPTSQLTRHWYLTLIMLGIFIYYTPPQFSNLLAYSILIISMYFQSEWKTVWILIS